jgi:hypothetical protein
MARCRSCPDGPWNNLECGNTTLLLPVTPCMCRMDTGEDDQAKRRALLHVYEGCFSLKVRDPVHVCSRVRGRELAALDGPYGAGRRDCDSNSGGRNKHCWPRASDTQNEDLNLASREEMECHLYCTCSVLVLCRFYTLPLLHSIAA